MQNSRASNSAHEDSSNGKLDLDLPAYDVEKYDKIVKIGQGTFGEVFKAKHRTTKQVVALKKVLSQDGKAIPITTIREIKILQKLKNANIVNLIEIWKSKSENDSIYLVLDFCEHDLAGLLCNKNVKFSLSEIKEVLKQLFNGLFYIHCHKIVHRDIKAANILITKHGVLKLADFGLARALSSQQKRYTTRVVTLWYRPPELLLGERNYGPSVDMWGAGCIMAEMWTRTPIFKGNSEQQQLTLITQLCGSITAEQWPAVNNLVLFNKMDLPKNCKRRVKERLSHCIKDPQALDLLDKLLCLDPTNRIDAHYALDHDFLWVDPMPSDLGKMLSQHTRSMFEFFAKPENRASAQPAAATRLPLRGKANDGEYHDIVF